jgi:hypothetical protein
MSADKIDFSAAKLPPIQQDNEEGGRPDDAYLDAVFAAVEDLLTGIMEIDLDHIRQPDGSITGEDMATCGIAALSKFRRDYLYGFYPARRWDLGQRRTKIGYGTRIREPDAPA